MSQIAVFVFLLTSVVSASELAVVPGYHLVEVSRDESPYTGTDGILIHGGDHYHDPCNSTHVGERHTWGTDSAKGFIVVNDCQIVTCRKWTTTKGDHGGETVVYDIVKDGDDGDNGDKNNQGIQPPSLQVQENSTCTCNYELKWQIDESHDASCFVSQSVLLVERYDKNCAMDADLAGPVASVACNDQPAHEASILTNIPDPIDSGTGMGSFLGGLALLLLVLLYCCCVCVARRRRRRTGNDTPEEQTPAATTGDKDGFKVEEEKAAKAGCFGRRGKVTNIDETPPVEEAPEMGRYRSSSVQSESGSKIRWFSFIGGNNDAEVQEKDVEAAKPIETNSQAKWRKFFCFNKSSGTIVESTKPVESAETKSSHGLFFLRNKTRAEVLKKSTRGSKSYQSKHTDSSVATKKQHQNHNAGEKEQRNELIVIETDEGVDLTCCGIGC